MGDFSGKEGVSILDFGAGRFRNTMHLLRVYPKNHVGAVEFKKLEGTLKTHIGEAGRFSKRFRKITYPEDFFGSPETFDLIILINVLNIMPIPSERLLAIKYCRTKLKENGEILWYTQHKDPYYQKACTENNMLGDGYYLGEKKPYQTFYRDFEPQEIDEMFLANGMKLERKIVAKGSLARLYKLRSSNPIDEVLTPDLIRKHVQADLDVPRREGKSVTTIRKGRGMVLNFPNPDHLSYEKIYLDSLTKIPRGPGANYAYQNLVAAILTRTLVRPPDYVELEKEIVNGQKRIDIVITNKAEKGFFREVSESFRVISSYVMVECKNYSDDLKNPEFDQLVGRFSDDWSNFGFVVCRENKDRDAILAKARAVKRQHPTQHALCLSDSDLAQLLNLRLNDPDEVDQYMTKKFEEIRLN